MKKFGVYHYSSFTSFYLYRGVFRCHYPPTAVQPVPSSPPPCHHPQDILASIMVQKRLAYPTNWQHQEIAIKVPMVVLVLNEQQPPHIIVTGAVALPIPTPFSFINSATTTTITTKTTFPVALLLYNIIIVMRAPKPCVIPQTAEGSLKQLELELFGWGVICGHRLLYAWDSLLYTHHASSSRCRWGH